MFYAGSRILRFLSKRFFLQFCAYFRHFYSNSRFMDTNNTPRASADSFPRASSSERSFALTRAGIADSIAVKERLLIAQAEAIAATGDALASTLAAGGKILFCGNGGSAADAQHIAAELSGRYRSAVNRRALPALALSVDPSFVTACANDFGYDAVFARGVEAHGRAGDALVIISASGSSPNVLNAAKTARAQDMLVVGLLGSSGGAALPLCHYAALVPSDVTARIQESHILIGHIWCDIIEQTLFPELFARHTPE
jgi:D-sedoheptulose 7-phosphate isomerase